jgi:tetratricopeptide (TPR) repeat protein
MNTEVHFENIAASILEELAGASRSIRVAVAWFTDRQLFDVLLQKASEGIAVIVIIRNDVINLGQAGLAWQKLLDANGTLYFSPNTPALHHKFCLIDDKTLLSGSYNWTYGARRNRENMVVVQQGEVIQAFRKEFSFLLDNALEVASLAETMVSHPPATDVELQQQAAIETKLEVEAAQTQQVDSDYEALLKDAWDAYRQKLHQKAEITLKKAIQLRPRDAVAHELLADVYWRSNQYAKAIVAAKEAEDYGVDSAELWNRYGLAYDGLKKYKDAIGYFDRCIKAAPDIATGYFNKCFALKSSRLERASDTVAYEAMRIASEEVKRNRNNGDNHRLLRAYIELAGLKTYAPDARKNAQLALNIFSQLPEAEKDFHDLDDINKIMNFWK